MASNSSYSSSPDGTILPSGKQAGQKRGGGSGYELNAGVKILNAKKKHCESRIIEQQPLHDSNGDNDNTTKNTPVKQHNLRSKDGRHTLSPIHNNPNKEQAKALQQHKNEFCLPCGDKNDNKNARKISIDTDPSVALVSAPTAAAAASPSSPALSTLGLEGLIYQLKEHRDGLPVKQAALEELLKEKGYGEQTKKNWKKKMWKEFIETENNILEQLRSVVVEMATSLDDPEIADRIDVLVDGSKELTKHQSNKQHQPKVSMQVFDNDTTHDHAVEWEGGTLKVKQSRKEKYKKELKKYMVSSTTEISTKLGIGNTEYGQTWVELYGGQVQAAEMKKQNSLDRESKRRREKRNEKSSFMCGYTKKEWVEMVVSRNNGQILKVFTKDGFVEKQMVYNKGMNRFENTDVVTHDLQL